MGGVSLVAGEGRAPQEGTAGSWVERRMGSFGILAGN